MPAKNLLLVPIDGSDTALRALKHACKRFRAGGYNTLVALNVQTPMPSSAFVSRQMIREHHARQSEEALVPARALAARCEVPLDCRMVVGDPAAEIVAAVRKTCGDEIVMGTRGLGRLGGLLLGSVAMKVVQLAPVPVTLVK
jgi:nucleotide-binding universal stress UspA family protein